MRYYFQSTQSHFASGLRPLIEVLDLLLQHESVTVDFSKCAFVNPINLLPFTALVNNPKFAARLEFENYNQTIKNYLTTVYFPKGLNSCVMSPEEVDVFQTLHSDKNYVPIINFSGRLSQQRDAIVSSVTALLHKKVNNNSKDAISLLISELTDNIGDHANTELGFIVAQYYQNGALDIGIADCGDGILGAFRAANQNAEIMDSRTAMERAVKGTSTKDNFGRGYGLSGSISMLSQNGGDFLLYSGDSTFIHKSNSTGRFVSSPNGILWNGCLVFMRVNTKSISGVDVYKYFS